VDLLLSMEGLGNIIIIKEDNISVHYKPPPPPIKDTPTGLKRKERKNTSVSIFTCGSTDSYFMQ
jgi:S-adenosylmethionine/arginine decarboxylase-like enzyme